MSENLEGNIPSLDEFLNAGGSKSLSFKNFVIGDSYEGTIVSSRLVQQRNYEDPTKLETWPDGKPKLQIEITLATEYLDPEDEDDTGERRVFLSGPKLAALKEELRKKGLTKLEDGSHFKITFTGTKPASNPRYNDVKLYGIELTPATSNPAVDALLAQGATEVAPKEAKKSAKIEGLTDKQLNVAKTLQSNGFTNEEIAENLSVSVDAVANALDLI